MTTKEIYNLAPSVGGSFSYGWKKMFERFIYLLVIIIIAGLIEGPFQATFQANEFHLFMIPLVLVGIAWGFLIVPVISYGEDYFFLKAMREDDLDIKDLFMGFSKRYVDIILANLIVFALVGLGIVMFVIPGIIIACRLAFVPYIVMDQGLEPMQAVEKSWKMTRGHGWKVFFLAIIAFFLFIAGLVFCFVGVFIAIMWNHAAHATLYQAVLNQEMKNDTLPIIEVHEE